MVIMQLDSPSIRFIQTKIKNLIYDFVAKIKK